MKSCSNLVTRLSSYLSLAALALTGVSASALAQDSANLAQDEFFSAQVHGDAYNLSISNAPYLARSMRVTGPHGFVAESKTLDFSASKALPDGDYNYEVTGEIPWNDAEWDAESNRANGRDELAEPGPATGVIARGHFRIVNGTVQQPGNETEEQSSDSR